MNTLKENKVALDPRLAYQSLGRPLTDAEQAFAKVLEEVFSCGLHDFAEAAAELERRRAPRPSGERAPWTEAVLVKELADINTALDASYSEHGLGA